MLTANLKFHNLILNNLSHARTRKVEMVLWFFIPINNSLSNFYSNLFGLQ